MKYLVTISLLLSVACSSGPSDDERSEGERNVIKEYVNTPKDLANETADKVEDAQDRVLDQVKSLDE